MGTPCPVLAYQFSWNEIDGKAVSFINAVLNKGDFEEMYAAIRESEQNTKTVLIAFVEKYPGVLGEENVDSVIENAALKSENRASVKATLERLKKQKDNSNYVKTASFFSRSLGFR